MGISLGFNQYGKAEVRMVHIDRSAPPHQIQDVNEAHPEITEIRFSMPNKHHFLVDLSTWGLDNPNEVWYAADRPYGLIEAAVVQDDAPPAERAWEGIKGFV